MTRYDLEELFAKTDCRELAIDVETLWYQGGREAYDYLRGRLGEADRLTEHQAVNAMLMLTRMRFKVDPEEVRRLLVVLTEDSRRLVRSRAAQYLAGSTVPEGLCGRAILRDHPEYVASLRRALVVGLERRTRKYVMLILRRAKL